MYLTLEQAQARLDRRAAACYDDAGTLNTAWLLADITTVEGLLNLHLAARYAVPVTWPAAQDVLRGLALDLLQEVAWRRLPSGDVPAGISAGADQARHTLTALAAGTLRLPGAPPATSDLGVAGNPPRLTRQALGGF